MIPPVAHHLRECYLVALGLAWLCGIAALLWHWRRRIPLIEERPGETGKPPGALILSEELQHRPYPECLALAMITALPLFWTLTFVFDWNPNGKPRGVLAVFAILPPLLVFGLSKLPLWLRLPLLLAFTLGLIYLGYVQELWGVQY